MCRYGMGAYKPHYACFDCRKTFKRRLLVDIDRDSAYAKEWENIPSKCPECKGLMADMGLDFESPKKSDVKSWNHIKDLYESGITFHSCGCSGPGYIPKDREKLIEFLSKRKIEYIEHRRFWSNRIEPQNKSDAHKDWHKNHQFLYSVPNDLHIGTRKNRKVDKALAVTYWTEKIDEVDLRLNKLSST